LLPDRKTSTVQQWLELHPEIEIITRDWAVAYASAASSGAPHATQVADRFHLLQNLTEAVQGIVTRQHRVLREVAQQMCAETVAVPTASTLGNPALVSAARPPAETKAQQQKQARPAWRESRF
jgi:transposase